MLLTRPPLPLLTVRLACVKHAASVRSEPGSNSQVHLNAPYGTPKRTSPNRPYSKRLSTHTKRHINKHPNQTSPSQIQAQTSDPYRSIPHRTKPQGAANVSLPIPDTTVNEQPRRRGRLRGGARRVFDGGVLLGRSPRVNAVTVRHKRR